MTTLSTIRLSTPADIAANTPAIVGFRPAESLVVMCLDGSPLTMRLALRYDIEPDRHPDHLRHDLIRRAHTYATAVVMAVYTDAPITDGVLPYHDFIGDVRAELLADGIGLGHVLLVTGGLVYDYDDPAAPGVTFDDPADSPVNTASVVGGRVMHDSRERLAESVAAPTGERATVLAATYGASVAVHRRLMADMGERKVRRLILEVFSEALAGRIELDDATAHRLIAAVAADTDLRDTVMSWACDRDTTTNLLSLLTRLSTYAPPGHAAPIVTMTAAVAYLDGNGALANIALERALADDTGYGLAVLLDAALHQGVPPDRIRAVLTTAAEAMEGR